MSTVIRIPKASGPPMAEGCDGILEAIDSVTRHFQGEVLSYARHVGQYLIELKAEAKREGKQWGELCERLPFSQDMAGKFIKIASNEALKHSEHVRNLPADTATLYTIARLPAPEVEKHIKAGRITPTMTRAEAAQLARGDKPAKTKPAKQPKQDAPTGADDRRSALADAWKRAAPSDREWFLTENRAWFERRLIGEQQWQ